jgi:hypothetical protein
MRGWRRRWRWRECSVRASAFLSALGKRHQAIKACAHSVGCSLTCAYGTKLKRVLRRADGLGRTNAAAQGRKQVLVGISFPVPSSPRARALFDRPACRRRRWRAWSVAAWPPRRVGRWRAHCVSQHTLTPATGARTGHDAGAAAPARGRAVGRRRRRHGPRSYEREGHLSI